MNIQLRIKHIVQVIVSIIFLTSISVALAAGAKIEQASAEGKTRADACMSATQRASAGKFGFLESQGRIQSQEKRCDCEQLKDGSWSCLARIAYVEKN